MANVGEDHSSNESANNKLIPSDNLAEQNAVNTADNVDVSKYSGYVVQRFIIIFRNFISSEIHLFCIIQLQSVILEKFIFEPCDKI